MRKKVIFPTLLLLLTVVPSLLGNNSPKAQVGLILEAVVDLFCPDNPQNRCKNGSCMDGACISFRKACSSSEDCK